MRKFTSRWLVLMIYVAVGGLATHASDPGSGAVPNGADVPGTALTLARTPADGVTLSWGRSCVLSDDDYAVYSGFLGEFTTHLPATCTTLGETMATLSPQPGSRYYIVVPQGELEEGAYGRDSSGTQRTPSTAACQPTQRIRACDSLSTACELEDASSDAFVPPTPFAVFGHSPTIDADLSDWCVGTTARVEDSSAVLDCGLGGTELAWWDAVADSAVNDLATVATTADATNLYWAVAFHVSPDPVSPPFVEIAIEVAPGGRDSWWDPGEALRAPGRCSESRARLCTTDQDCHFCAASTVYSGTAHERARACGTTFAMDSCDPVDPTDVCIRTETCLDSGGDAPFVGRLAEPSLEPDFLLVFDSARVLLGLCDAVKLFRSDAVSWVPVPRPVPDPACPSTTWEFLPAINSGSGAAPGILEFAIPWSAFDCAGCEPFQPHSAFQWTVEVNRGALNADYAPDGAIEDVMSEAVSGASTTTTNACP